MAWTGEASETSVVTKDLPGEGTFAGTWLMGGWGWGWGTLFWQQEPEDSKSQRELGMLQAERARRAVAGNKHTWTLVENRFPGPLAGNSDPRHLEQRLGHVYV